MVHIVFHKIIKANKDTCEWRVSAYRKWRFVFKMSLLSLRENDYVEMIREGNIRQLAMSS